MNIYEVLPFYTIKKKALMSLIHYYKPITTDLFPPQEPPQMLRFTDTYQRRDFVSKVLRLPP